MLRELLDGGYKEQTKLMPPAAHQRQQQHGPLEGHKGLQGATDGSGEAERTKNTAEGDDGEICPIRRYGGNE